VRVRTIIAPLAVAALLLGAAKCDDKNKSGHTPVIAPDHGAAAQIVITWTIRGVSQRESHLAAPGGQRDRVLLNATSGPGPDAWVEALQQSAGLEQCIITYVNPRNGLLYTIDYEHSNGAGDRIRCNSDATRLRSALARQRGREIPQPQPEGCSCDPGTLTLNVTWARR
jgi:hypothetical protein